MHSLPRLALRISLLVCVFATGVAHAATFKPDATVAATQSTLGCQTQALFKQAQTLGQAGKRGEVGAMFDAKQCVVVQNAARYKVQSVADGSMALVPLNAKEKTAVWVDPDFFVEK